MSLFTIDKNACTACGNCVAECPLMIIAMPDKETGPIPVKNADALCIDCGHCVAVCPHDALDHRCGSPGDLPLVDKNARLDPVMAEQFLRQRRSIRTYRDKPVELDLLREVIRVARYAPSGHNTQPVKWLIIHDTEKVRKMTGLVVDWMKDTLEKNPDMARMMHFDMLTKGWDFGIDAVCRSAPHLVIVYGQKQNPMARDASTIALSYFELAAYSFGLGSCWAGYFSIAANAWEPLKKELNLPEGHVCMGTMMVGYPKYRYRRLPQRNMPDVTVL